MVTESTQATTYNSAVRHTTKAPAWVGMILVFTFIAFRSVSGQAASIPLYEKQDLRHSIAALSKCLRSRSVACVARSISRQGITVGVDGPRVTSDSLVHKLKVDHAMQCLFWGTSCSSSNKCSVSDAIGNLDVGSPGKPRMYENHWQVDLESKPSEACSTGLPLVFQLEEGYWKLKAVPYT